MELFGKKIDTSASAMFNLDKALRKEFGQPLISLAGDNLVNLASMDFICIFLSNCLEGRPTMEEVFKLMDEHKARPQEIAKVIIEAINQAYGIEVGNVQAPQTT